MPRIPQTVGGDRRKAEPHRSRQLADLGDDPGPDHPAPAHRSPHEIVALCSDIQFIRDISADPDKSVSFKPRWLVDERLVLLPRNLDAAQRRDALVELFGAGGAAGARLDTQDIPPDTDVDEARHSDERRPNDDHLDELVSIIINEHETVRVDTLDAWLAVPPRRVRLVLAAEMPEPAVVLADRKSGTLIVVLPEGSLPPATVELVNRMLTVNDTADGKRPKLAASAPALPMFCHGTTVGTPVSQDVSAVLSYDPAPDGGGIHVPVILFREETTPEQRLEAVVALGRRFGRTGQFRKALRAWERTRPASPFVVNNAGS